MLNRRSLRVKVMQSLFAFQQNKEANYLLFEYKLDQWLYLQHRDQDSRDHTVSLNTALAWKRVALEGADRVQILSGILGGGQNLGQKVERISYYDNYRLDYALTEKTGVYGAVLFDADRRRPAGGSGPASWPASHSRPPTAGSSRPSRPVLSSTSVVQSHPRSCVRRPQSDDFGPLDSGLPDFFRLWTPDVGPRTRDFRL